MPRITISPTDEILVDGSPTGYTVATDKDGAFLVDPEGGSGNGRHDSKFDVARAFRFIFFC